MKTPSGLWHSLVCGCHREQHHTLWRGWVRWLYPLMSAAALAWFLFRVIPKPIRATYPCQQAAFPLASTFIIWLLGVKTGLLAWLNFRQRAQQLRPVLGLAGACCLLALAAMAATEAAKFFTAAAAWTPTDPPNTPLGTARGLYPGRVVWVHNPQATTWDGNKNNGTYWWDQQGADQAKVDAMLSRSLRALTGTNTDAAGWDALFRFYNQSRGLPGRSYQAGDRIVIKINQNTARTDYAMNGNNNTGSYGEFSINGNPHLIKSLLRQLINHAGVPQTDITVYDASRWLADSIYVPNHQEFPSVHFMDAHGGQGRELVSWSSTNAVAYAVEHSLGRKLPLQVMNAAYVINMSIMKNHGDGPTLGGKNHYGSINGQGDHSAIYQTGGMNTYANLVDLMGHKHLGEKTVLFMVDALYGSPTADADPAKWKTAPFTNWWPSSLLLSQDGVAIDSVGFDFMNAEWGMNANSDNYLHEAAQANSPPSGLTYAPNYDGVHLSSLGVHEHWNNSANKQYTRNLSSNGVGIELLAPQAVLGLSIAITNPVNGSILDPTANPVLETSATSLYSPIRQVDFYRAGTWIGSLTNSPFHLVWSNAPPGAWPLTAVLTDSDNFSVTSAVVNVTVQPAINVAPFILAQPTNQAALLGSSVAFRVDAEGWPAIQYQWRKDGIDLKGDTAAVLSLTNLALSHAGGYCTVLSNVAGVVTSAVARLVVLQPPTNVLLVSTGSLWSYFDKGQDLGTNWRAFVYTNEITWSNGYAELGYGDGPGRPEATVVSYGSVSTNKYPTTYFRRSFVAPANASFISLLARLLRDDGAVVYLNGQEAFRCNLTGTGPIYYTNWATATVANIDEYTFFPYSVPVELLWPGTNVLAVEIHQGRDSSDISFDLELTGQVPAQLPQILAHPAGQVREPGQTATFSVEAASATPMTMQWLFNAAPLSNATNRTLIIPDVTADQAGPYYVVLSNAVGAVTSASAWLTVVTPPLLESRWSGDGAGFVLQVQGTGLPCSVWTSTNLIDWSWWTNPPVSAGVIELFDPALTNRASRFYRVRLEP